MKASLSVSFSGRKVQCVPEQTRTIQGGFLQELAGGGGGGKTLISFRGLLTR